MCLKGHRDHRMCDMKMQPSREGRANPGKRGKEHTVGGAQRDGHLSALTPRVKGRQGQLTLLRGNAQLPQISMG